MLAPEADHDVPPVQHGSLQASDFRGFPVVARAPPDGSVTVNVGQQRVRARMPRALRPDRRQADPVQRLDSPLLSLISEFPHLLGWREAQADTRTGRRSIGISEQHPPLIAVDSIVLASVGLDDWLDLTGAQVLEHGLQRTRELGIHQTRMLEPANRRTERSSSRSRRSVRLRGRFGAPLLLART
jgi:hypothetical protein